MADETRSRHDFEVRKRAATFAAVHTYWAVYGHTVGSNPPALMDALYEFWMARFREEYPFPRGFRPEEDEQAPAASEAEPAPGSPSQAVENDGSGWIGGREGPIRGELERLKRDFD